MTNRALDMFRRVQPLIPAAGGVRESRGTHVAIPCVEMKKIFKSVGIAIEALAAPHLAFGGAAEGQQKSDDCEGFAAIWDGIRSEARLLISVIASRW